MLFLAVVLWRSRRGAPLSNRWTGGVVPERGSDVDLQADEGCVLTNSEELDVTIGRGAGQLNDGSLFIYNS
jgi:hypothetical protein